jgi:hypothetical protein
MLSEPSFFLFTYFLAQGGSFAMTHEQEKLGSSTESSSRLTITMYSLQKNQIY